MCITYENDLEEHLLIDLHELLVPLIDIGSLLAGIGIVIIGSDWIVLVMLAPLDNLAEDWLVDLKEETKLVSMTVRVLRKDKQGGAE